MADEEGGFGAEMAKMGVRPLEKRQHKVVLTPKARDLNVARRRELAASELPFESHPDQYAGIEWLGPHDIVEFKRPGIQHETFKNLKQGRYDVGASLDLHQYRVEEARAALLQFIHDCGLQGVRCAIIVHGKGWHASGATEQDEGKPVSRIKSHVAHWLKLHATVQAYSSAQARDGGTGALYVLFKKTEKARDENHRRFRPDEKN